MNRPTEEQWARQLLFDKCPHMFGRDEGSRRNYARWRIGWQDTLGLMALARDATIKEMQKRADLEYNCLTMLITEKLPCDPAMQFKGDDCDSFRCKWFDVCRHVYSRAHPPQLSQGQVENG